VIGERPAPMLETALGVFFGLPRRLHHSVEGQKVDDAELSHEPPPVGNERGCSLAQTRRTGETHRGRPRTSGGCPQGEVQTQGPQYRITLVPTGEGVGWVGYWERI
jgi:hypothetical protein